MHLFGLIIPSKSDARTPLYVNINGNFDLGDYSLDVGSVISFDTYFGCFSVSKFLKYTTVTSAKLSFVYRGGLLCRLLSSNGNVICEREFSSPKASVGEIEFDFKNATDNEFYYPVFVSTAKDTRFLGGVYSTDAEHSDIKLAIVTCTYKREDFVIRTAERIKALCEDSDISDAIEYIVVDNGKTLEGRLPECDKIHLFYNKNVGGSGGFTRGMIEAYRSETAFTHILMMDDDIDFDENVLIKTVSILRVLKPEYRDVCIAGGMLRLDDPTSQFEAGARREGVNLSNKSLTLVGIDALLANDKEEKADYGGWWYYCMPMSFIRPDSLPMPYFIKDDDVEFSLRNNAKIMVVNGVGVWHRDFNEKYVPYLDYYMVRNGLVTNSVYHLKTSSGGTAGMILERICRSIVYKMPEANRFYSMALGDFLKGPQFFFETDPELLNTQLRCIESRPMPELEGTDEEKKQQMRRAVFTAAFWRVLGMYLWASTKYLLLRGRACRQYAEAHKEMTSLENWQKILEI